MWEGNPGYQLDVAIAIHEYVYVRMSVYVCVCMCASCWWPWAQCSALQQPPMRSWIQSQCRGYAYRRTLPRQRRQRSRRSPSQGQLIGQEVQPASTSSSSSVQRERFVWAAIERQSRFQNGRQNVDLEHSPFIGYCSQGRTAGQQEQCRGKVAQQGRGGKREALGWTIIVRVRTQIERQQSPI